MWRLRQKPPTTVLRISKISFSKIMAVLMLSAWALPIVATGNSGAADNGALVSVGTESATTDDFYALFGKDAQPDSTNLQHLADYLRKLHEARRLGVIGDEKLADSVRRLAEGIAVYEVTRISTVERAARDSVGVEEYFRIHRSDYAQSQPRFYGSIVLAADLQTAQGAARELLMCGADRMDVVEAQRLTRRLFGTDVRIIRVAVECGRNPFVDYAVFGGALPEPEGDWAYSAAVGGYVLTAPRSAADVGERIWSDYAAELERCWTDSLRRALPARINAAKVAQMTRR